MRIQSARRMERAMAGCRLTYRLGDAPAEIENAEDLSAAILRARVILLDQVIRSVTVTSLAGRFVLATVWRRPASPDLVVSLTPAGQAHQDEGDRRAIAEEV